MKTSINNNNPSTNNTNNKKNTLVKAVFLCVKNEDKDNDRFTESKLYIGTWEKGLYGSVDMLDNDKEPFVTSCNDMENRNPFGVISTSENPFEFNRVEFVRIFQACYINENGTIKTENELMDDFINAIDDHFPNYEGFKFYTFSPSKILQLDKVLFNSYFLNWIEEYGWNEIE